jgi:multidrug efflux pump subunit AcrA (membrane-fusion protein)
MSESKSSRDRSPQSPLRDMKPAEANRVEAPGIAQRAVLQHASGLAASMLVAVSASSGLAQNLSPASPQSPVSTTGQLGPLETLRTGARSPGNRGDAVQAGAVGGGGAPISSSTPLAGTTAISNSTPLAGTTSQRWLSFPECPVLLERVVDVPALESGVIEKLEVELNAVVRVGQPLAQLDQQLVGMELQLARLQHKLARELAEDDSDVKFYKLALSETQQELDNYRAIRSSVSENEMRRITLGVGKAQLNLLRAEQALKHAGLEAELKGAAVQAAEQRVVRRTVKAPLAGVVTEIHLHAGQWAEAGRPICRVASMEQLLVDCLVPLEKVDLRRVVGLEVRVQAEQLGVGAEPVRLAGRILSYDPEVSSQGLVRVHARIQNVEQAGHWLLLPGMNVTLEIAVPSDAPPLISRQPSR